MEIRSFDGTAEELSEFVVSTWKASYTGAVAVPNWTAEYFRWQLQMDSVDNRQHLVAAYDDSKLAGVVLYFPRRFELDGQNIAGAHASWFSVHADYRRQGIGALLKSAAMDRSREQELQFHVGYVFHGSKKTIGPRFWLNEKKNLENTGQSLGPNLGFWARALDARRVARWSVDATERLLARIGRPFVPAPTVKLNANAVVRPFQEADLSQCVELANDATRHCDLRLLWNSTTLKRQLEGFGKCLVSVQNDSVRGFTAYHSLVFSGQCDERVGVIDMVCVSRMDRSSAAALLDSVLTDLQRVGAIVALKLRCGDYPSFLFRRWGWFPVAAHSRTLFSWTGKRLDHSPIRRSHLLWR